MEYYVNVQMKNKINNSVLNLKGMSLMEGGYSSDNVNRVLRISFDLTDIEPNSSLKVKDLRETTNCTYSLTAESMKSNLNIPKFIINKIREMDKEELNIEIETLTE